MHQGCGPGNFVASEPLRYRSPRGHLRGGKGAEEAGRNSPLTSPAGRSKIQVRCAKRSSPEREAASALTIEEWWGENRVTEE